MLRRPSQSEGQKAARNFLLGERSLRAYFAGGNVRFLEDAEASFAALPPQDRRFQDARFYLGVAKTELRKTSESIAIFEDLRRGADKERASRISLQLAYAHIKNYTEHDYQAAKEELDTVAKNAAELGSDDLRLQAAAFGAFLYSVLAGRSETADREQKLLYAVEAIKRAESLLKEISADADTASRQSLRFEALNALGIAWMRFGELGEEATRAPSWANAQKYYNEALAIIPGSVRALQNLTQLRMLQAERSSSETKRTLLQQAKQYCEDSLAVSDQDQFPFLLLAGISNKLGDGKSALAYIQTGRMKPGAVKEESWVREEEAAQELLARTPDIPATDVVF